MKMQKSAADGHLRSLTSFDTCFFVEGLRMALTICEEDRANLEGKTVKFQQSLKSHQGIRLTDCRCRTRC